MGWYSKRADFAERSNSPLSPWFRLAHAERFKDVWIQETTRLLQNPSQREAIAAAGAENEAPKIVDHLTDSVRSWKPWIDHVDRLISQETGLVPPTLSIDEQHTTRWKSCHFHYDARDVLANLLIVEAAMDVRPSDSDRAQLISDLGDIADGLERYLPRSKDPGPYRKLVDLLRRALDGWAVDLHPDLEFKQDLEAQAEYCSELSDGELEFKRDLDAQADHCNIWSDEELCEHGVTVSPVRWPEAPRRRGSEGERVV